MSVVPVKGEKGNTSKGITFFPKISTGMNSSIWFLPGISWFSIQIVTRSLFALQRTFWVGELENESVKREKKPFKSPIPVCFTKNRLKGWLENESVEREKPFKSGSQTC